MSAEQTATASLLPMAGHDLLLSVSSKFSNDVNQA